ncbi:CHAD domain-containing protein [Tangfeifania diversioriginum]|uniref:CHAD domain-containing protein n=1 Tax=Tangfeifania diversioriginum TaxID=1168035 RepID=A0A1M6DM55_9BACT|nr:CHAD domain-containing protein [Tangfeifania diversioriginum]SHI74282.1 CHAD domain-containing protein [Tangfeifania diversioriginum]
MTQNAGNKLAHTILRQTERAEYFCSVENISPNITVHELRKIFKRLRSLIRFYEQVPGSEAKSIRKEIKQLGKILSPLRESYVNVELFEKELTGKKLIPERKIKDAEAKLHGKNKKAIDQGFKGKEICKSIGSFFSKLESSITGSENSKVSKVHLVREINNSYLTGYIFFSELPDAPTPEAIHSLRKKLKRLFYQLDFIRLMHPKYFKARSEQLNIINDHLGDDHDLHILAVELRLSDYQFNSEEQQILENQIEHLREMNQLKLWPRLKQFFSELPEEFEEKAEKAFKLD